MALDRFVYWKEKKPTHEQILQFIKNFLDGAANEIAFNEECNRYIILLWGNSTFPYKGLGNPHEKTWEERYAPPHHERFIEVWLDDECVDFITREADEYTNAVSEGLAAAAARFWQGKRE